VVVWIAIPRLALGGAGQLAGPPERGHAAPTFALARTCGGMILSGPKDCRGSTNDARILPVFLHSPVFHLSVDVTGRQMRAWQKYLLLIDDGSGLLRLNPMVEVGETVEGKLTN
jgi:hypothetical protein